ncbi:DUF2852 domain-containing protein [Granulosicoccus sp.]|nr:DUF2852 domain-containing protein [Granulosicoccus sp.]MDB4222596.1 DUF2852 domain-containing protein [Granulosicoccus sp.]
MSSSQANTVGQQGYKSWSRCGNGMGKNARWSGVNIAAMVVGFVFFWPVGLVVLFWIMSGRQVQELPGAIREQWGRMFGNSSETGEAVDNVIFNEYQQTQYDRIREIKEEIKTRSSRFGEFRMNAKRRADQEEFNSFMSGGPYSNSSGSGNA